jgi:hypothetical protein
MKVQTLVNGERLAYTHAGLPVGRQDCDPCPAAGAVAGMANAAEITAIHNHNDGLWLEILTFVV